MLSYVQSALPDVTSLLGWEPDDLLGEGYWGSVFSTPDPTKVVKITRSKEDKLYADAIVGETLEYSANIYKSWTIEGDFGFHRNWDVSKVHIILMERVDTDGVEDDLAPLFDLNWSLYPPASCIPEKRFVESCLWVAGRELNRFGCRAMDVHCGNIGIKNGHYCLFDQRVTKGSMCVEF